MEDELIKKRNSHCLCLMDLLNKFSKSRIQEVRNADQLATILYAQYTRLAEQEEESVKNLEVKLATKTEDLGKKIIEVEDLEKELDVVKTHMVDLEKKLKADETKEIAMRKKIQTLTEVNARIQSIVETKKLIFHKMKSKYKDMEGDNLNVSRFIYVWHLFLLIFFLLNDVIIYYYKQKLPQCLCIDL